MSARTEDPRGERGAALLMVLMIVAVMSVIAVGAAEAVSYAARRGANVAARNQALWYLGGAEALARATLERSHALDPERTTLDQPWAAGVLRFEVDGGLMEGALSDAGNCFNLNRLARVRDRGVGYDVDTDAVGALVTLLTALDIDPGSAERLAGGAADWIDADGDARADGAEDFDYAFADPPYRAANSIFVEVDELRGLSGVSEGVFRAVRPYLCAYEPGVGQTLNVNTVRVDQAALLVALFDGRLALDDAQNIIRDRPPGGWTALEEFWAIEAVGVLAVDDETRDRIGLRTRDFALDARVRHRDAYVEARVLFRVDAGGRVTLVRRRLGDQT